MATKKLYDEMPYETEFEGRIEEIKESGKGTLLVVLDATLFFPEEGGQSSDTGTLGGYPVIHVSIDGDVVSHEVSCEKNVLATGDTVKGRIDWDHRFSNMQNHSAEHILSGLLHQKYQSENTGFHLSDHIVTLDTSKELSDEDLRSLEEEANEVVYQNLPVTCRYYTSSEIAGIEYRSKKEIEGDIRLVIIPGVDVCACCAPHVAFTGEIGVIRIVKAQRHRGGMRLMILAGRRAHRYLAEVADLAEGLAESLSVGTDRLREAVEKLAADQETLRIRIKNEAAARLSEQMEKLSPEDRDAVLFTDAIDSIVQRNAVNTLSERGKGVCAVFASDENDGYNFILSYPGDDARKISALLKEKLGARGGGSAEMVQGNIKASEEAVRKCISMRDTVSDPDGETL